jgi:hypothetical protein
MVALEPKADSVGLTVLKNPSGTEDRNSIALDTKTLLLTSA